MSLLLPLKWDIKFQKFEFNLSDFSLQVIFPDTLEESITDSVFKVYSVCLVQNSVGHTVW